MARAYNPNFHTWGIPPIEAFEATMICQLRWEGATFDEIALRMGRSDTGVKKVCYEFEMRNLQLIPEWCERYGGQKWKNWARSGFEKARLEESTCREPSPENGSSCSRTPSKSPEKAPPIIASTSQSLGKSNQVRSESVSDRLRYPRILTTKSRSDLAIEAMLKHESVGAAARELGVARASVRRWLGWAGLKPADFKDGEELPADPSPYGKALAKTGQRFEDVQTQTG